MLTNMLLSDYVSHIDVEIYFKTAWHFITYGLAPCSYDIYLYCKFGIVPIVILLAIIGVLAILIIKRIGMFSNINKNGNKLYPFLTSKAMLKHSVRKGIKEGI